MIQTGMPDLSSPRDVEEFVLRAQAYEKVTAPVHDSGPCTRHELRAVAGTKISCASKTREEFKVELGLLALTRLDIDL